MFVFDQKNLSKRIGKTITQEYAGLQRYIVPQGIGKFAQTPRSKVRTAQSSSGAVVQVLFKSGFSLSHYELAKVQVNASEGAKLQLVRGRATKKTSPAELATKPALSMDAQRNAWNEDLLARWEFEPAESFASKYLGSNAVGNKRQLAHQLRLNMQCLAVSQGHRWLFPIFQIDPDTKRPYPEILALIDCYPGMTQNSLGNRSFSLLRWMDQAHSELSGATPMQRWQSGDRAAVVRALKSEL